MEITEAIFVAIAAHFGGLNAGRKQYKAAALFQAVAFASGWYFATH